jgi:hypothetical protein
MNRFADHAPLTLRFRYRGLLIFLSVVALLAGGCKEPKFYPVRGEIVVFGVGPLTEGEVQFRPVKRPDLIATGKVQKNGKFSLSTPNHGEGVLEGDCQVAIIVEPKNGKRAIAERYGDFSKSDMLYTVAPREENYFIFDVKRAGN